MQLAESVLRAATPNV